MAQRRQRWHNCGVSTTFALAAEKRACTSMAGCGRWPNKAKQKIQIDTTKQHTTALKVYGKMVGGETAAPAREYANTQVAAHQHAVSPE